MTIRANISRRYYGRFALIALVGIGFAFWFLYDGAVAWPRQQERGLAYKSLVENEELTPEQRSQQWRTLASEKGWPLEYPGEPKTDDEITMQFIMATLSGTVGLWFLVLWLRCRKRWIELSGTTIRTSRGQELDVRSIERLNKRQWRNKGIAKAYYMENGRRRKVVIDDFMYERPPTDEILLQIEQHIGEGRIVGGPREALASEGVASEPGAEQVASDSSNGAR